VVTQWNATAEYWVYREQVKHLYWLLRTMTAAEKDQLLSQLYIVTLALVCSWCTGGRVVEWWTFDHGFESHLRLMYVPTPTQHAIPMRSVYEYERKAGE